MFFFSFSSFEERVLLVDQTVICPKQKKMPPKKAEPKKGGKDDQQEKPKEFIDIEKVCFENLPSILRAPKAATSSSNQF